VRPIYFNGAANPPVKRGILSYMKMNRQLSTLLPLLLGTALVCASVLAFSQPPAPSQDGGVKQDTEAAGHDTKDAAKDTGHTVKHGTTKAYSATKRGTTKTIDASKKDTKKAYHATEHGTKKTWDKTKDTTKGAVQGAKEGSKEPPK
jgi:hypothetical protein